MDVDDVMLVYDDLDFLLVEYEFVGVMLEEFKFGEFSEFGFGEDNCCV